MRNAGAAITDNNSWAEPDQTTTRPPGWRFWLRLARLVEMGKSCVGIAPSRLSSGPLPTLRLRTHLLVLVLAALLPALGLAIYAGAAMDQGRATAQQQRLTAMAASLADAESAALGPARQRRNLLAEHAGAMGATALLATDFPAMLSEAADINAATIILRQPNGMALLSAPGFATRPPPTASWNNLAQAAIASGGVAIGTIAATDGATSTIVTLLLAVMQGDAPSLYLEMRLPADQLSRYLRGGALGDPAADSLAVLIDPSHRIAAASRNAQRKMGDIDQPAALTIEARANLEAAPGWQVIYCETNQANGWASFDAMRVLISLGVLAVVLYALALVWLVERHLARGLDDLKQLTRSVVIGTDAAQPAPPAMQVAEFEELRQSMLRADAVLRRRGAAERMALREARTGHELLNSVVNGTAESIHVKDLDLRYVLVNRAALESGGEAGAEWQVLGRQSADLFPPSLARRIEAADRRVLASGQMMSFEHQYTPPGSTLPRWIAMTIAPWKDALGNAVGVVSVSRDVTKHRQAEMRLRRLQAELLRATRLSAMGAMASGLAHELNQPLAAATNYLNAGGRLLERGDEAALLAARGAVADAAQQMLRAGMIVRRLRDFVERGEVELQPENVAELLRETCDLATADGHADGISLKLNVPQRMGIILVDRTQIGQVLLNLIRNAAEAIQGVETDAARANLGTIEVCAQRGLDGGALIEVIDNGPGLAAGISDRLFEPFVSSKRSGMGIGLSICRTIIEGHGGTLTCVANPIGGMIFRISLPALLPQGVAA